MIFEHHKTIFFHIGRTAGTSVEFWLWPDRPPPHILRRDCMMGWDPDERVWLQHATPELVRKFAGDRVFEGYFKFSLVRNPFSRAVSVYRYGGTQHKEAFGDFAGYVRKLPDLVREPRCSKGSHHLPQSRYVFIGDDCVCDFLAHFESLPGSLAPVADGLHIRDDFPKMNCHEPADDEKPVAAYYDDETAKMILSVYAEDFDLFGYGDSPEHLDPAL